MVLKSAKRKVKTKLPQKTSARQRVKKLAIIVSLFNEDVCQGLLRGAVEELKNSGFAKTQYEIFYVAGAFEIPFMAKKIAETKKFSGMVALGCVIKGETPHFEYVCRAVTDGCLQVQLTYGYPLAFGVLTVNTEQQAKKRSQPNQFNKGREAVMALLDTLKTIERL